MEVASLRKRAEVARCLIGQAVERKQLQRAAASDISPIKPHVAEIGFGLNCEVASALADEIQVQGAILVANAEERGLRQIAADDGKVMKSA